jgi:hypothetical protein
MNKTKTVRNTDLYIFVFPDFTVSFILQFFSNVNMVM